eukprot:CAMPEP_0170648380 /NCGR_PEP_ID=MMETSP0224-20130122/44709_1 /TAXON_ID=285029 /ORGANISM="Togula jolla, Strain CCCM 725" /LENGTH=416 /DNA_ID=CAMNT_0010979913 /DNA_START=1 /DNA_END=1248 /DNA_ORIENTATION=+
MPAPKYLRSCGGDGDEESSFRTLLDTILLRVREEVCAEHERVLAHSEWRHQQQVIKLDGELKMIKATRIGNDDGKPVLSPLVLRCKDAPAFFPMDEDLSPHKRSPISEMSFYPQPQLSQKIPMQEIANLKQAQLAQGTAQEINFFKHAQISMTSHMPSNSDSAETSSAPLDLQIAKMSTSRAKFLHMLDAGIGGSGGGHSNMEKLMRLSTVGENSSLRRVGSLPSSWGSQLFSDVEFRVDFVMGVAIIANMVVLAIEADSDWDGWITVDTFFSAIYLMEMIFKLRHEGCRKFFTGSNWRWNVFDIIIVALGMLEVFFNYSKLSAFDKSTNWSSLRVVRLTRLVRMMRLARYTLFNDLIMMINGAAGGIRTLFWSTVLLVIPVFTFALFLRETIGRSDNHSQPEDEKDSPLPFGSLG